MTKLKKEPTIFKTQREAFWHRKGFEEAKQMMNDYLDNYLSRYNLEYLDHLPTGDEMEAEK